MLVWIILALEVRIENESDRKSQNFKNFFLETNFLQKRTGTQLFSGEGNRCSTVLKRTVSRRIGILCASEGNWCCTVLKRTGALLFSEEGNRCSTFLKRTGTLLFLGEGNR